MALPKAGELGSIMVVVDKFSKYGTFIPFKLNGTAEEAARLFMSHVVKLWGIPTSILSDRDPRFTGKFWTELFRILGTELLFSTAFHPQTDGQTERINALLEEYLRHYVCANQQDWVHHLDVAQFCYNLRRSESSGHSPFELVLGRQPVAPHTAATDGECKSPVAKHFTEHLKDQTELAKGLLERAAVRMKRWADEKRRPLEFQPGDRVMLKFLPRQYTFFRKVHQGLVRRYDGPYTVLKRIGKAAYKLELPPNYRMHPVFHVSLLKAYREDPLDPSRGVSQRAPGTMVTSLEHEAEKILDVRPWRKAGCKASVEYLVRWKNRPKGEVSWEKAEDLWAFKGLIEKFQARAASRAIAALVGEDVTGFFKNPDPPTFPGDGPLLEPVLAAEWDPQGVNLRCGTSSLAGGQEGPSTRHVGGCPWTAHLAFKAARLEEQPRGQGGDAFNAPFPRDGDGTARTADKMARTADEMAEKTDETAKRLTGHYGQVDMLST